MSDEYILQVKDLSKSFPGVKALDKVRLDVKRSEVHAVIGENGAGKSTLMKIIIGILCKDEGEIIFAGELIEKCTPKEMLQKGISMIHQEISLSLNMSVAENIWLGRNPKTKLGLIDYKKLYSDTTTLLKKLNLNIDPKTKVNKLSIAQMQMVEIARAISYNARLIIMDEPTSALSEKEIEALFKIISDCKKSDVSIILITHKLDEIFKISDCISVYRDGQWIGHYSINEINKNKLVSLMVGRSLDNLYPKNKTEIKDYILTVKDFNKEGVFRNINFGVKEGEILGVSGLMGAGRTEIMNAVFGIDSRDSGEIWMQGNKINIKSPRDAIKNGIAMVTEDRKRFGLSLCRTVKENVLIASLKRYSRFSFEKTKAQVSAVNEMVDLLSIKISNQNQQVDSLSGGNQQKVILARWILTDAKVLIFDEPTRGIDVGAKAEVHKLISDLASEGKGIILVSSELPELLGMSDRIIVVYGGEIKAEFKSEEATQDNIMKASINM